MHPEFEGKSDRVEARTRDRSARQAVSEQPREAGLLREAVAGDPEALRRLYDRYADEVYRLAFRLTESSADAQDVVQDVFLGLPEALRSYAGEGQFEGWLKKVAARTALMKLRRQRMRREVPLSRFIHLLAGGEGTPTVDRMTLERAIAALPEGLRFVVVLREIEGFSHREIASVLGISQTSSEVRHFRGLRALRAYLRNAG